MIKSQEKQFLWIPFYKELAQKLLGYKNNSSKLATLLYKNFDRKKEIKFLQDKDNLDFKERFICCF